MPKARRPTKQQLRIDGGEDELLEPDDEGQPGTAGRPPKRSDHIPDRFPLIVRTGRLARLLGLSERRMQQLRNEGMPQHARGRWDLELVIPWALERVERKAAPEDGTVSEAQRRYYLARATSAEMDAARAQGEHVPVGVVDAIVAELATDIAGELHAYPTREHDDPHEREIAIRVCESIAVRLADRAAGESTSPGDRGAPAKTRPAKKRERVGG